jgi:hypothetical protein
MNFHRILAKAGFDGCQNILIGSISKSEIATIARVSRDLFLNGQAAAMCMNIYDHGQALESDMSILVNEDR